MNVIGFGIDPGAKLTGFCLLDFTDRRPRWLDAGQVDAWHVDALLYRLLAKHMQNHALFVTIEKSIGPVIEGRRSKDFHEMLWQGGIAEGQIRGVQHNGLVTVSLQQWRAALIGAFRRGDQDKMVKAALSRIVTDFPKVTNTHERDAAGAVMCGYQIWMRGQRRTA